MVQIIPKVKSFGEEFAQNLGAGFSKGVESSQEFANKFGREFAADENSFNKIKDAFGEKFANIWKASPTGARTELTKAALDARSRGLDLDQVLGSAEGSSAKSNQSSRKEEMPEYKLDTTGMTPKERIAFQSDLRKENTDQWKENVKNYSNYKALDRDINMLEKLNDKKNLPEGLEKLLIDPETGNFYPAITSIHKPHADAQQWVKILARQATQAQTAFPGRVTNFDLQAYMAQFPSLFNTYDGRKGILQMMKLSNKANEMYSRALDDVYRKYKQSGITPEDAQSMAADMVRDDVAKIDEQLVGIAAQGQQSQQGKKLDVLGPDGQEFEVDESEVEMLPEGYRLK